ncbi:MAG: hypothetical protein MZV70_77355 [Desulfobacterales bacterium]|nr:hypothetical protein [Desulfobacterales bacterium]
MAVLKRMRAPNELIDSVYACAENHMNFMSVSEMRLSTLKKFLARPTMSDELELHRIDCLASHGNLDNYRFVKRQVRRIRPGNDKTRPDSPGRRPDFHRIYPGPFLGQVLGDVHDLQLEEKIVTLEQALAFVRQKWPSEKLSGENG